MLNNSFLRNQFPAIFWTVLIFVLSSFSSLKTPDLGFHFQDKLHHFIFYSFYGFLLARAFFYQDRYLRLQKFFLLFTVLLGSLYGLSDEIHQYFVPGRMMDFWDFLADMLGVSLGAFLFHLRLRLKGAPEF